MKKKLLIIDKSQYGYLVDVYKWCTYLQSTFDITVICFDTGHKRQDTQGVKVVYVPWKGPYVFRGILFLLYSLFFAITHQGTILVEFFIRCEMLPRLLFWKKEIALDIRTLSVHKNDEQRTKYNAAIKQATRYFNKIFLIAEPLNETLQIPPEKLHILPLGSDIISHQNKDFSVPHLLYVGTLSGRSIEKTLSGLALFVKKHPDIPITYDIIGDGFNNELASLRNEALRLGINDIVTFHGRIPHEKLTPYFDKCNVGLSFVPIAPYYDHQPPTKTYEYILSGLYCIATATQSNKQIITPANGTLISDTPESISHGIEIFLNTQRDLNSEIIRNTLKDHTWSEIVNKYLADIL